MLVSVLLCSHQPRPDPLRAALLALREQTLESTAWELILVDSACQPPLPRNLVAWQPRGRVVREEQAGLTRARTRGIAEASGDLLIFCDDDNVFTPDYLRNARRIFAENSELGAGGGKSLPSYETEPPAWLAPFADRLAVRDFGAEAKLTSWNEIPSPERNYPVFSPIGAGLVLRRSIAEAYLLGGGALPSITDRVGSELRSGGDNALVLAALSAGWGIGYFPDLVLTHLIPEERLRLGYLARLNRASSESWVGVLAEYGLNPWAPISRVTLGLRQTRAFLRHKAWRDAAAYFSWAGACGILAGRAQLPRQ